MLTPEQSFFLQVLADHAAQRTTRPPEGLDWECLIRLAVDHQVHTILYSQCGSYLAEQQTLAPVSQTLEEMFNASRYAYIKRRLLEKELKQAFTAANIPCLLVKGSVTAACYPVPELRTMGDTDVVVSSTDRPHAHEILLSLGYENTVHGDGDWIYYRDGMEFELHDRLLFARETNPPLMTDYFNHYEPYVVYTEEGNALSHEFHFMYLILHLRNHFLAYGMGFRPFYDLAMVAKNTPVMDWTWITVELKKLGLADFFHRCMGFCSAWFDVDLPVDGTRPIPDFYDTATRQIFAGGLLGFSDPANRSNYVINSVRMGKSRFATFLSRFFPSYQTLLRKERYDFLRRRPFLLPAAWCVHLKREASFSRLKRFPAFIAKSFVSRSRIDQRDAYLKDWGL